MKSACCSFKV